MRVLAKLRRGVDVERLLHLERRSSRGEPGAVCHPENVSVDRNLRLAEHHVENDVRGLASDTRQCFELGTRGRYLAPVPLDELLRETDEIPCLGVVETYRLDVRLHALHTERCNGGGRVGDGEEVAGRGIDAAVGGVC